jgi:hypothetical protein
VNDDVLSKSNPLFIVNGRSNIIKNTLPVQRAPPKAVHAAASFAASALPM